ncbi:glycosyltransferase family 39 protein [Alicyclobacillus sp. SO9]|uniref:glycosyltransferase family 39 protein n=1 Tax=Alicyclobacillus sp. SO9 TaxID=2665646 RepID=UPI0018E71713|nr:glycosyltransferase family 39 protein [Alicyclobacillus sp. SO9]
MKAQVTPREVSLVSNTWPTLIKPYPLMISLMQIAITAVIILISTHLLPKGPLTQFGVGFSAWDGQHYTEIAKQGYGNFVQTAFFPMYPLLIRAFHSITQISYTTSATLLANAAYAVSTVLFYRLTKEWFSKDVAWRALWLLAVIPAGLFFNVDYTESITLLSLLSFFYFLQKDKWYIAMISGFVAAGTHDLGVLLTIPALIHWRVTSGTRKQLLSIGLIPLSLLSYMSFLFVHFGNPIAFVYAQQAWHRIPLIPVIDLFLGFAGLKFYPVSVADWVHNLMTIVNGLSPLLMVISGWWVWKEKRFDLGLKAFYTITLLLDISSGTGKTPFSPSILTSFARLVVVLFPAYMVLAAKLKHRRSFVSALIVMFLIKITLTALFSDGFSIL